MDLSKPGLTKAEVEREEYLRVNKIHFADKFKRIPTCLFRHVLRSMWRKRFEKRLPEYKVDYGQPNLSPEVMNAMIEYQTVNLLRGSIIEVV